jgi:very-short-patch-repair endonuclease
MRIGTQQKYQDVLFVELIKNTGLPIPEREYRFHNERKWRFDYAYPEIKLAIEIEGGIYNRKAHGSITGIKRDIEKYTAAAVLGWRIIRILPEDIMKRETIQNIVNAYNNYQELYYGC